MRGAVCSASRRWAAHQGAGVPINSHPAAPALVAHLLLPELQMSELKVIELVERLGTGEGLGATFRTQTAAVIAAV